MVDEMDEPVEKPVVVGRLGVRGVDFIDIWHSPEAPNESIKWGEGDSYLKFRGGTLVALDDEQDARVELAAEKGHYLRSDPKITEPFECQICGLPWYSQVAFTRHTKFSHTGTMTRK